MTVGFAEHLYGEHRMRFVRLAMLLVDTPATAEDVVQEALTGLHPALVGLRDEIAALGCFAPRGSTPPRVTVHASSASEQTRPWPAADPGRRALG